jgi:predicted nucleotidyltransferase
VVLTDLPDLPHLPTDVADHVRAALREVAGELASLPSVQAVVLGGSWATGQATPGYASDLDLYVYAAEEPPLAARGKVAERLAAPGTPTEIGNTWWEAGDEWTHRGGVAIDVMYRTPAWLEAELDRVLVHHQPSLGYTTSVWHNVRWSAAAVDTDGWYAGMQQRAADPYPAALRTAILDHNVPLLRDAIAAFSRQLVKATDRDDRACMLDRAGALLGSYFDVLFALNWTTHPGEKRQVDWVERTCSVRPSGLRQAVTRFATAVGSGDASAVPTATHGLTRPLLELVARHASDPPPAPARQSAASGNV